MDLVEFENTVKKIITEAPVNYGTHPMRKDVLIEMVAFADAGVFKIRAGWVLCPENILRDDLVCIAGWLHALRNYLYSTSAEKIDADTVTDLCRWVINLTDTGKSFQS